MRVVSELRFPSLEYDSFIRYLQANNVNMNISLTTVTNAPGSGQKWKKLDGIGEHQLRKTSEKHLQAWCPTGFSKVTIAVL
jgi:hypothetical protein